MMTSYIIFAFVSGFLLSAVIFWIVTKQIQKDWQAEYRRLMGGINYLCRLILNGTANQTPEHVNYRLLMLIKGLLNDMYDGEDINSDKIWPRK